MHCKSLWIKASAKCINVQLSTQLTCEEVLLHTFPTRGNKADSVAFIFVFSLLFTSKTMSKKANILCIWGLRCGNGEEREIEGKYLVF